MAEWLKHQDNFNVHVGNCFANHQKKNILCLWNIYFGGHRLNSLENPGLNYPQNKCEKNPVTFDGLLVIPYNDMDILYVDICIAIPVLIRAARWMRHLTLSYFPGAIMPWSWQATKVMGHVLLVWCSQPKSGQISVMLTFHFMLWANDRGLTGDALHADMIRFKTCDSWVSGKMVNFQSRPW